MKEKWNGFSIKIVYKARLSCSKNELLEQFEKAWPKITSLHQELLNAPKPKPSQLKLWQKFLQRNIISLGGLCKLIVTVLSIPVNTGWVERAYSTLEMICAKRRNRLDMEHLKHEFFLAILKIPVKDAFSYNEEIKNIGNNRFLKE